MTARFVLSLCALTLMLGCKGTRPDAPLTGSESLHDLMESMESAAKPLFARTAGAPLTETELPTLTASANRILAINAAVKTRFASKHPATFVGHSEQLEKGSQELVAALQAKDAAATQAAVKTIDGACGACHKEFKQ
ncbi:MAG: cytochrome c [Myxococcales bacterium]|jgi:hypothetical protein|nr:cytochrome c [Myxococcales bacterium]